MLTDAGQIYLDGCRAALDIIEDTERRVASATAELRGTLRVFSGTPFAFTRLSPVLEQFSRIFPDIQLHFITGDREINLVEEGVDVAILVDYWVTSDTLISRPLLKSSYILVAAPHYLASAITPRHPPELKELVFIGRAKDHRGLQLRLADAHSEEKESMVALMPRLTCNNALMLQKLALEGAGFAILPFATVEADLLAGSLVQLLPMYRILGNEVSICLVYRSRKNNSRIVQTFIEHLLRSFNAAADLS
jgi:DNA-binding transcriptional LysR family regulator